MLIGKVWLWMTRITLLARMVDLLLDMPHQPLSCATAGGGQLWHALFLQTRAEFGLPAALGTITLVTGAQVFVERSVMRAGAGRDEIGNAYVDAYHRHTRQRLYRHFLILGEREPPRPVTLIELHAGVELLHLVGLGVREGFFVVRSQFDGHHNGLTFLKDADGQPVIIDRIAGLLQFHHIDIGLNTGFAQGGHVPFVPPWLFGVCRKLPMRLLLLVAQEIVLVVLIGGGPIGAPGPGNASP